MIEHGCTCCRYEEHMGAWSLPLAQMLISQLRVHDAEAVLEVACGTWRWVEMGGWFL